MATAVEAQYRVLVGTDNGTDTYKAEWIESIAFSNKKCTVRVNGSDKEYEAYNQIYFSRTEWNLCIDSDSETMLAFHGDDDAWLASATTVNVDGTEVTWTPSSTGRYDAATSDDFRQLGFRETTGLEFDKSPRINLPGSGKTGIQGSMSIRVPVSPGDEMTVYYSNTGTNNGNRKLSIDGVEMGEGSSSTTKTSLSYTVPAGVYSLTLSSPGLVYYSIVLTEPETPPTQVATPVISFDSSTGLVSISCTTSDASIYYSTGENTTGITTTYTAPFSVTEPTTIYATAQAADLDASEVAQLTVSRVATPTLSVQGNRVSIACTVKNATLQYSTDGGTTWTTGTYCVVTSAATTSVMARASLDGYLTSETASVAVSYNAELANSIMLTRVGGWFEAAYAEWEHYEGASGYNVYCRSTDAAEYTRLDAMLVRRYAAYDRADAVGLKAGTYKFKVVATDAEGNEIAESTAESEDVTVIAHDRSGWAFTGTTTPGAYKADGTLKDNAIVLYLTKDNVSTISYEAVKGENANASATYTGLQTVLSETSLKNLTVPLCIRLVGTVTSTEFPKSMWGSSAEGLQVKTTTTEGVTIEGIGEDATIKGFGILCRSSNYVELRNFGIMLCADDCISLDSDNLYTWVHNIDFFYGGTGSDSDQAKGDGSLDLKGNSKYNTYTYNHFWDSGKMSLCGMKSESGPNYISYHHNWFDHSDSRHPRVRTMTVHVYNNYFDGNSKYGVGATMGSNVFVENNYYRNCNRPMMSSKQGTDATGDGTFSSENGGMIKSFGNVFAEKSGNFSFITANECEAATAVSATSFDAYEASTRNETVPSTYKTLSGGTTYSNFDTDASVMYSYTPDAPADARDKVLEYAGRMNGGDFRWTFDNSVDDASYDVNTELKAAITAYTSSLVSVYGAASSGSGDSDSGDSGSGDSGDSGDSGSGDDSGDSGDTSDGDISGKVTVTFDSFTKGTATINGVTITGNLKSDVASKTYNGATYTTALKMESATSISFTTTEKAVLTLITDGAASKTVKVDGNKQAVDGDGVITLEIDPGSHTVTKGDTMNLYAIIITPSTTTE